MATYAERLQLVRDAIDKILTKGQSHSVEGRSMTRADLPTLMDMEERYARLAERETGGGILIRAATPVDA